MPYSTSAARNELLPAYLRILMVAGVKGPWVAPPQQRLAQLEASITGW